MRRQLDARGTHPGGSRGDTDRCGTSREQRLRQHGAPVAHHPRRRQVRRRPGLDETRRLAQFDEVARWSAPWRPTQEARFSFLLRGGNQLLRVEYDSPGGPLEVRADGAAVVYILRRPGPVSEATASQLAEAMFAAPPPPARPPPLAFMPSDAEGVRFYVRAGSIPDERLYTFKDHHIGLYGGLLAEHRIEFVSLYWNGAVYSKSISPPRWSAHPDYLRVWIGEGRDPRDGEPPPMPGDR